MSAAESYGRVSRALRRRIASVDGVVRVVADDLRAPLAHLLDERAAIVQLSDEPSYAIAEAILTRIEERDRVVRLVLLVGDEWTRRFLSGAGVRPWPVVFEPLRGLTPSERSDFVRRACIAARAGSSVCGIKPWRSLDVDASKR